MIDKQKFYRVVNGIEDWVAYCQIDPTRLIPPHMAEYITVYFPSMKVVDLCWSTIIAGNTYIRLGKVDVEGTLVTEEQFDLWLSCVEETDVLLTFEEYSDIVHANQPEEI